MSENNANGTNEIVLSIEMSDAISAQTAEAWAVGKRGGVDVADTDPTYHNNAKYYAEQCAGAEQAAQDAEEAAAQAESAKTDAEAARDRAEAIGAGAAQSAGAAAESAQAAATAKAGAESAQTAAAGSANSAAAAATSAASSASTATGAAAAASSSETAAGQSASAAAGSATAADQSAQAAAQSAEDAQEVLDSIPADYSQLSDDVSGLKSAVNNVENRIDAIIDIDYGKNRYDLSAKTASTYLNPTTGETTPSTGGYDTSDFIPVPVGEYATFSQKSWAGRIELSVNSYAFYDRNKTFIPSSGSTYKTNVLVPSGAYYIRICFSSSAADVMVEITDDGVFTTPYVAYFPPKYELDDNIHVDGSQVDGITDAIEQETVKGFNVVKAGIDGVGAYYSSNGSTITFDGSATSYHYAIIPVKKNTRYYTNVKASYWILVNEGETIVSYGSWYNKFFIDTGNAVKLYYTIDIGSWNAGLIIAEGMSGTSANVSKPSFIQGLNQLMADSWFAAALPFPKIRFTQGLEEKLYYHNMIALSINDINLNIGGQATKQDDGVVYNPVSTVSDGNGYFYTVYDSNMSIVANSVNGSTNRIYVVADNVQNCSALIIGDSIIAYGGIGQQLLSMFAERNKTITLLGTLGTGDNKNEGRAGWKSSDYFTDKTYDSVVNPFYNPSTETFDFSFYMSNNGYSSVDYVVLHIGANDLYNTPMSEARAQIAETVGNICAMIDSILAFNPNQKIILELFSPVTKNTQYLDNIAQKEIRAKFTNCNAVLMYEVTKYNDKVRVSNDYLVLDPNTDIADNIHPNAGGFVKLGKALFSQINCWQ